MSDLIRTISCVKIPNPDKSDKQFSRMIVYDTFSISLFGVLRRFQHCTGHITTGSWKGRGNQYIQFVRVLYCKLPTASNYQLSHLRLCREQNPGHRGGRRECYHSATDTYSYGQNTGQPKYCVGEIVSEEK